MQRGVTFNLNERNAPSVRKHSNDTVYLEESTCAKKKVNTFGRYTLAPIKRNEGDGKMRRGYRRKVGEEMGGVEMEAGTVNWSPVQQLLVKAPTSSCSCQGPTLASFASAHRRVAAASLQPL